MTISLRTLLKAAGLFGLTTAVVASGVLVVFDGVIHPSLDLALRILGINALAAIGYALLLLLARHNFRSDARIGGRRDAVAGAFAMALVVLGSTLTQGGGIPAIVAVCLLSGVLGAIIAHFPWLQRRSAPEADPLPREQ